MSPLAAKEDVGGNKSGGEGVKVSWIIQNWGAEKDRSECKVKSTVNATWLGMFTRSLSGSHSTKVTFHLKRKKSEEEWK